MVLEYGHELLGSDLVFAMKVRIGSFAGIFRQ